ncbi:MAG TPA: putative Ig domain-containing protein, partial [Massilibacterium sp.]|nr:putative Ig domain-containing protein [Massilibacterium sp.]
MHRFKMKRAGWVLCFIYLGVVNIAFSQNETIQTGEEFVKTETLSIDDTNEGCRDQIRNSSWPGWLTSSTSGETWTLSGSTMQPGNYNVEYEIVRRTWGGGGRDGPPSCNVVNYEYRDFVVTVENQAPEITSNPPASVSEGENLTYSIDASDPEGDNLTYSKVSGPGWLSISGNTLSGTPGYNAAGDYSVKIRVADGSGGTDNQSWTLSVSNTNRSPSIDSSPPTSATEGNSYSYSINASDPDGDDISYSKSVGPDWLSMSGNNLTGTPGNNAAGNHNIEIKVSDGNGGTDTQSYTLNVSNTNRAPSIDSSPPTNAEEGSGYSYS